MSLHDDNLSFVNRGAIISLVVIPFFVTFVSAIASIVVVVVVASVVAVDMSNASIRSFNPITLLVISTIVVVVVVVVSGTTTTSSSLSLSIILIKPPPIPIHFSFSSLISFSVNNNVSSLMALLVASLLVLP